MTAVELVRWIGLSHLLQPPLTLLLASSRGLHLRGSLTSQSPLAAAILHNMAVAAVVLPTALGLVIARHAGGVFEPGAIRDLALLVACFWSWRLYRQLHALNPEWPSRPRLMGGLKLVLIVIFAVQGPVLGGLIWLTR
jgi:hypothetical protein